MDPESLLSPAEIAELHDIFGDGMKTVEEFSRPDPIVQLRRYNETTGTYQDVGDPFHAISISFGIREGRVSSVQQMEQDFSDGEMVVWADQDTIPVPGDRFTWQGFRIEVERVFPPDQGIVTSEIRLQNVAP